MTVPRPALPSARNPLGYALFYWLLVRPAFWQSFDRVRVQQVGRLPAPADSPVICYCNHPSWWDLYTLAVLDRMVLGTQFTSYGMMEEAQLRDFPFFRLLGAFSVNRHNARSAARSLAYITHELQVKPRSLLYMFPQGTITPNDQRPLHLYGGLARIVQRVPHAMLYPVTFRYEFRGEQRPETFVRYGPLHTVAGGASRDTITAELTARLTASADALRAAVVADDMQQFRVLLRGIPGINRRYASNATDQP